MTALRLPRFISLRVGMAHTTIEVRVSASTSYSKCLFISVSLFLVIHAFMFLSPEICEPFYISQPLLSSLPTYNSIE